MAYSALWREVVTKRLKLEDVEIYNSTINQVCKGTKRIGNPIGEPKSPKLQVMDLNDSGQVWVAPGPGAEQKPSEVNRVLAKKLERLLTNSRGKPASSIKPKQSCKIAGESVKTESRGRQDKKASKSAKSKEDPAILKAKLDRDEILRLIHAVLGRISELEMSKYGDNHCCIPCVEDIEERRREALTLIDIYHKSLNNVNVAWDALNFIFSKLEQEGGESGQEKLEVKTALMQARLLFKKFGKKHYADYSKLRSEYRQKYATEPLISQRLFHNEKMLLYPHEQYLLWKVFLQRFNNVTVLMSEELRLGLLKPQAFVKSLNGEIASFKDRFPMNMEDWEMLLNFRASKPNPERQEKYDQLKTKLFANGFPRIVWLPYFPRDNIPKIAPLCPAAKAALEAQGFQVRDAASSAIP